MRILDTISLSDNYYVDLVLMDMPRGMETHLMKKTAEPNRFESVIEHPGDHRQFIIDAIAKRANSG